MGREEKELNEQSHGEPFGTKQLLQALRTNYNTITDFPTVGGFVVCQLGSAELRFPEYASR